MNNHHAGSNPAALNDLSMSINCSLNKRYENHPTACLWYYLNP